MDGGGRFGGLVGVDGVDDVRDFCPRFALLTFLSQPQSLSAIRNVHTIAADWIPLADLIGYNLLCGCPNGMADSMFHAFITGAVLIIAYWIGGTQSLRP